MSDQKKLLPHVHAVMGDVQMPVVKATDQDVQYVAGFRGDLPFLHAVTEDGKAQVPVVKVLGAGDGPTPGGDSIEQGDGINIATVGDKKVISTVVPISKKGSAGKHRYWRWDILTSVDPASPRLRTHRIRAADEAGGNIVFAPESVSASSEYGTYKVSNLFKEDETQTGWATRDIAPAWVSVDTGGNPVEIRSFFVQSMDSFSQAAPDEVVLSFSDDGISWIEVARAKMVYDAALRSQLVAVSSDQDVPVFIGEAPEDGKAYNRKDGDWVEAVAPDSGLDIPSLPSAGAMEGGDLLPVAQSANPPGEGWRVVISRSFDFADLASTGSVYVYEIEFRGSAGGTKHPNGTLVSSGTGSGALAFDGKLGSNSSSTAGATAVVLGQSYGTPVKVNELALYCQSSSKGRFPAVFQLERRTGAADSWEVVESFDLIAQGVTPDDLPNGGWVTFDVSGSDADSLRKLTMERFAAYIKETNPEQVIDAGANIKVDSTTPGRVVVDTIVPISKMGSAGRHRFWRWTIHNNYGHHQVALRQVVLTDTSSVVIPVERGTDTAFSDKSEAYPVGNAFYSDAGSSSFWESSSGSGSPPLYIGVEFAEPKEIGSYTFTGQYQNERPREVTLQYSDDGINYTDATDRVEVPWSNLTSSAIPVGTVPVPRFPPYPPKDDKVYAMRNDEWEEIPQGRTYGAFVNYPEKQITTEGTGIEMQWGTAGAPPSGRVYRISCVLALDGDTGAEVGISFSDLQAETLRVMATYTASDGSLVTQAVTDPDEQLVVVLGLEKMVIILDGTMIDNTFHPTMLDLQVQLVSGTNAKVVKGTLATLVDVGILTPTL